VGIIVVIVVLLVLWYFLFGPGAAGRGTPVITVPRLPASS
jgi:hypothetical protein